jgi:YbbR domain-containing protein
VNSRKILAKAAENWPAKVLSIALAIVLFVFHRMSTLEARFFSIPLLVEGNGDLVPASSYPRMIRVSLRGEANSIYPILEEDIEAYLDLSPYTEAGAYRVPVQARRQGTALEVEPLEISLDPLEVSIELDKKVSKSVALVPRFQGYPEEGYELTSYTLTPNQVVVDGPARLMGGLSELSTETMELGGRSDDFSAMVRIVNRESLFMIRGDGMAELRARISKLFMIRNIENLPVRISGLKENLYADPEIDQGSIRLEGGQNELEHYAAPGLFLDLDCRDIDTPGTYVIPVKADVPAPFTLLKIEPGEITVHVTSRSINADNNTAGGL